MSVKKARIHYSNYRVPNRPISTYRAHISSERCFDQYADETGYYSRRTRLHIANFEYPFLLDETETGPEDVLQRLPKPDVRYHGPIGPGGKRTFKFRRISAELAHEAAPVYVRADGCCMVLNLDNFYPAAHGERRLFPQTQPKHLAIYHLDFGCFTIRYGPEPEFQNIMYQGEPHDPVVYRISYAADDTPSFERIPAS